MQARFIQELQRIDAHVVRIFRVGNDGSKQRRDDISVDKRSRVGRIEVRDVKSCSERSAVGRDLESAARAAAGAAR
jgi:hypothetical protein